jgi:hypothetical protein
MLNCNKISQSVTIVNLLLLSDNMDYVTFSCKRYYVVISHKKEEPCKKTGSSLLNKGFRFEVHNDQLTYEMACEIPHAIFY